LRLVRRRLDVCLVLPSIYSSLIVVVAMLVALVAIVAFVLIFVFTLVFATGTEWSSEIW
jgi:hypothetical protein